MRLWALAPVKVVVLVVVVNNGMLSHCHSLLSTLGLHANCRVEGRTPLNIQDGVLLHIRGLGGPGVLRNFLVLRNWTATVINCWRKHNRLLEIRLSLLLLHRRVRHHTPVLTSFSALRHANWLGISPGVLELLFLIALGSLVLIYLTAPTSVWNFEISSAHVCSAAIDMTDLHLGNEQVGDLFIVVSHKAEPSTSFGQWIANDLIFFDLSELREMLFESLISEVIVQTSNKYFVPNARVSFVLQFR